MKEINPQDAYDLLKREPETIYLDVRSIPEFEEAHPVGAINIPLLHFAPGMGMIPNNDFINVVEANVAKNAKVLVGCKTGGRSSRAYELLAQAGYSNIANVRGGFLGVVDHFGRLLEPGWSMLDLPVCKSCKNEAHYESLSSKAGK
jgi:rhodanese-related sulfurtransferase